MDDLIKRKAVIEAIVSQSIYETKEAIAEAVRNDYKKSDEWLGGINDAISTIEEMNDVPAVPLDKLCEWLTQKKVTIPCKLCEYYGAGDCTVVNDVTKLCPDWRKVITKWMEEQDAQKEN